MGSNKTARVGIVKTCNFDPFLAIFLVNPLRFYDRLNFSRLQSPLHFISKCKSKILLCVQAEESDKEATEKPAADKPPELNRSTTTEDEDVLQLQDDEFTSLLDDEEKEAAEKGE